MRVPLLDIQAQQKTYNLDSGKLDTLFKKHPAGDFPEAERAASEVLALPIYPELTREMQAYVVEKVREFYD